MSEKLYFESIKDIILFNWWRVQEGKLEYCRLDLNNGEKKEDEEAYIRINDSYLDEFGMSREQLEIIEIQRRIGILNCDLVIDDNMFLLNEIRRLEKEIDDLLNRPNKGDRDGLIIHLEKWLGFRINEKEITANKFYKIVREYEREIELMNKAKA